MHNDSISCDGEKCYSSFLYWFLLNLSSKRELSKKVFYGFVHLNHLSLIVDAVDFLHMMLANSSHIQHVLFKDRIANDQSAFRS